MSPGTAGIACPHRSTGIRHGGSTVRWLALGSGLTALRRLVARATAVAVVSLMAAEGAQSEVISAWNFNTTSNGGLLPGGSGNFGPSPFTATTTAGNVTVGGLTRGAGIATGGTGAASGWGGVGWDGPSDLAAAVTADHVVTFTVNANPGFALSLAAIAAYNVRRSASGPATGQWQYSTDGTSFTDIGSPISWGGTTTDAGNPQPAIDLSGIAALQNLPATTTVTFRVANWDASSSAGTWYFNGAGSVATQQSLTLDGTVAVPEPSALGLAAVGLALAGLGRYLGSSARCSSRIRSSSATASG
jgi:hypothetical protein